MANPQSIKEKLTHILSRLSVLENQKSSNDAYLHSVQRAITALDERMQEDEKRRADHILAIQENNTLLLKVIMKCQKDIADIKTKFDSQVEQTAKEISDSKEKITILENRTWELETKVSHLTSRERTKAEADNKFNEDCSHKISVLQLEVKETVKHLDEVKFSLEELIIKDGNRTSIENFEIKMKDLQKKVESGDKNLLKHKLSHDHRIEEMKRELEDDFNARMKNLNELVGILGMKIDELSNSVEKVSMEKDFDAQMKNQQAKIEKQEEMIQCLEERIGSCEKNYMFKSRLVISKPLENGQRIKIDKCLGVWFDHQKLFDREQGCFVSPESCQVLVAWRLYQDGEGELKAYLGMDSTANPAYLGVTRRQHDVCCGIVLKEVKKGQKMWMEVMRVSGKATVICCVLMGIVIR